MPRTSLNSLVHYLQRITHSAPAGEVRDGELLKRFARGRDEAAFELLVWRHGPMVLGLCRRLLRHEQDAEDAFQATFLALARKAGSIANGDALASWLYKVAYRVACRARRRVPLASNGSLALEEVPAAEKEDEVAQGELRGMLDREIGYLPERYRRVIVLCYFEGKTQEEAAHVLRCPKGTVAARLTRARERLGQRLKRRGWALSTGALAGALAAQASAAAVPANLTRATVQAALAFAAGKVTGAGLVPANVIALTEGVLRMLWISKLKMAAGAVLALLLAGTGTGLAVRHAWASARLDPLPAAGVQLVAPSKPLSQLERDAKAQAGNSFRGINAAELSPVAKLDIEVRKLRGQLAGALKEIEDLKASKAFKEGTTKDEARIEVIQLGNANAVNVARVLGDLFKEDGITLAPLPDNNSLLVKASAGELKRIRELVEQSLDQPQDQDVSIRAYTLGPLKHARAADVANVLRHVYGSGTAGAGSLERNREAKTHSKAGTFSIAVDERSNGLVLACSAPRYEEARALAERLEEAAKNSPPARARLIPLRNASAAEVAKVLRDIYGTADKSTAFSADARSNRLVIRCPESLAAEIDVLVRELDVK